MRVGKHSTDRKHWKLLLFFSKINLSRFEKEMKKTSQKSTVPSRIDVTSRQLILWEFSTHNSVISATTFVKNGSNFAPPRLFQAPRLLKSRNQVVQLPITISATASLKIRERFRFSHKSENKTVYCITMCTEK